jgi:hypothetical protein
MSSLRGVCKCRTICEVLREINDLCQESSQKDQEVRKRVTEASNMAKRMSRKLVEYNKKCFAGWWKANPDYNVKVKEQLRKAISYKT